jgi:metal-responsive CopG/Arc/MetJ family transcriptional regulator
MTDEPQETKPRYIKLSITLREDVYRAMEELMKDTGLDRSGAISLSLMETVRNRRKKEEPK